MKTRTQAAGVVGLTAVAVLLWLGLGPPLAANGKAEGAAMRAVPSRHADRGQQPDLARDVHALLSENTAEAWARLVALYPSASDEVKRRIVDGIARTEDLDTTLRYLLATVGDDPIPAQDDPLVAESATLLKDRWRTAEQLNKGRQTMLMQASAKRQWLVASAMIAALREVPEGSPLYPQKVRLTAKLVDLHARVSDTFIRSAIVDGVTELGGGDAALILAKGAANVSDDELTSITTKREAREQVLDGLAE